MEHSFEIIVDNISNYDIVKCNDFLLSINDKEYYNFFIVR